MAHLLISKPPNKYIPVFFNVDAEVGAAPAANRREDVLLVQFLIYVIAKSPDIPPELVAAFSPVQLTGTMDPATLNAIRVVQQFTKKRFPNQVVDGRVSPSTGGIMYGGGAWTIGVLNDSAQNRNLDVWPRIDKIKGCPPEITELVIRTVAGIGISRT